MGGAIIGTVFLFSEVNKGLAIAYVGSQGAVFYKGLRKSFCGKKMNSKE